jgi:formamidopyrimidine-DNA glycosylase
MKSVGPDLLSEEISFPEYKNIITQKRISKKEICKFLLDQKYFSGIGNWILSEIMYECGIAPSRTLGSLSEKDILNLYTVSVKILKDAYAVNGLTITNYINPDGELGTYNVKVYMKDVDPEGNEIVRSTFSDKRTVHWVPSKQK